MPLFVFDLNEGDSLEWADEDLECDNRSEIEQHALLLLEEASTRMAARGAQSRPSTVVVFEENGQIIMSMHGWHKGAVRVRWLSDWEPSGQNQGARRSIAAKHSRPVGEPD